MAKSSSSSPADGKRRIRLPFAHRSLLLFFFFQEEAYATARFQGIATAADVIPGYLPPTTVRTGKEKVFARCEVASAGNAIGVSAGLFVAQRDENLQGQQVDSNGIRDDQPGATGLQKCSRGMQEELSVSSSRFRVIVDN